MEIPIQKFKADAEHHAMKAIGAFNQMPDGKGVLIPMAAWVDLRTVLERHFALALKKQAESMALSLEASGAAPVVITRFHEDLETPA